MGYYTNYDIVLLEGDEVEFDAFLKELALESDYPDIKNGYLYDAKWYDWEKNAFEVSKRFPSIYFMIYGDGEDSEDVWKYYCRNGKYKYVEMVWPEVHKEDLE